MESILGYLTQPQHQVWLTGGALVLVHGYLRFNTPPTSRSRTTAGRYQTAAILYTLGLMFAWVALTSSPDLLHDFLPKEVLPDDVRRLSLPLYVALALTVLLPSVPKLSKYDERGRAFLQDLARIPYEAVRLAAMIRKADFEPDQDTQVEVKAKLAEAAFRDKDVVFGAPSNYKTRWTKLATLRHHLDGWEGSRRFGRFWQVNRSELEQIDQAYQALLGKAQRLYRRVEALEPDCQDGRVAELLKVQTDEFEHETAALEKRVSQAIAEGVLQAAVTERGRTTTLEQLGFRVDRTQVAGDRFFDKLTGLFLALLGYYELVLVTVRPGPPIQQSLVLGAMIATIYVVAVSCALLPKGWRFARADAAGRPVRAYAMSGVVAFGFSLAASTAVGTIIFGDLGSALNELYHKWPWGLMGFATAFVTAFNADNSARRGIRWVEAGTQAVVAGASVSVVYWLLPLVGSGIVPPLERLVTNAVLTGAVIGFCVPTWYRSRRVEPVSLND